MGRRIDYYNDPEAPAANSMVPSVNVLVPNEQHEILLIRRSDNDNWAMPGGGIDIGESPTQAGIRETKEETGIDCEIVGLVGIFSNPKHVILYTSDGEVRQEFSIVLAARAVGGTVTRSSESTDVRWIDPAGISAYQMHPSMRQRIEYYLSGAQRPHVD